MMKLLSSLLPSFAILSCFSAEVVVQAKTLDGNTQLQLLVGLETRLDHSEMYRIFSTPNHHRHLKADKVALKEKAEAHFGTCLHLYRSSIDDYNKSSNGGRGIEIISLAKDSSRFYLAGSAKDFALYLKKSGDNKDDFISFEENLNEKNQVKIIAKYEDGRSAKKFSEELTECTGFLGAFGHRVSLNSSNDRRLNSISSKNEDSSSTCPYFPPTLSYMLTSPRTNSEIVMDFRGIEPATPDVIRAIYGVPTIDNTCDRPQYLPRDAAVFEAGVIGTDDLACYNKLNNLQDTTVTSIDVGAGDFGINAPNGICALPDCVCPVEQQNGICVEANLDVQMIAAMSAGTDIKAFNYNTTTSLINDYEDLVMQIINLEEDDNAPSVISFSYGDCYNPKAINSDTVDILIEICKHIGKVTMVKGTTFFVSSGDNGATDSGYNRIGHNGIYCQNALAACPYVTAVGGSFGSENGAEELSTDIDQGYNIISGGGFSNIFTTANGFDLSFQSSAVNSWRQQPEAGNSLPGYTLPDGSVGRGFPDVSAKSDNILELIGGQFQNQCGTSAASPLFAGIVNLCASQLPPDQVGFGWINPILYKNEGIFYDIVGQNNSGVFPGGASGHNFVERGTSCSDGNMIARGYLTYDGSLGDTVFVIINSKDNIFVTKTVAKDESIAFGFDITNTFEGFNGTFNNFKEVSIIISDSDPNDDGSTLFNVTLSTVCPGLWTIGSEIISDSGFVLNGFIRYIRYNDYYSSWLETVNITEYFFGFEATKGWDPASGLGTLGISGGGSFDSLCKVLLGAPFDFNKLECGKPTPIPIPVPTTQKSKKSGKMVKSPKIPKA